MTEEIKDILKRYDEIGALILEQKLDEYGDKIGQVPEGSDAASFEEYIQDVAREETEKAKQTLESEPDEKLGGKSLREYFDSMTLEEKEEALEYSAVTLDCGVPASLIASIASEDRESVRDYCSTVIGDSAWTGRIRRSGQAFRDRISEGKGMPRCSHRNEGILLCAGSP